MQLCVCVMRPYVWGEKCLEHQTLKKTLGDSLWKQPTTEEVLDLLDRSVLQQSIINFPLTRSLDVRTVVVVCGFCSSDLQQFSFL